MPASRGMAALATEPAHDEFADLHSARPAATTVCCDEHGLPPHAECPNHAHTCCCEPLSLARMGAHELETRAVELLALARFGLILPSTPPPKQ